MKRTQKSEPRPKEELNTVDKWEGRYEEIAFLWPFVTMW